MDTSLLVAITSGIVALISVIITSVVTLTSTRRNKQSEKEIEKYKLELAQEREKYDLGRSVVQSRIRILGEVCTNIQIIRDDVRRLPMGKVNSQELILEIIDSAERLKKIYQDSHFIFPQLEARILHDVKSQAYDISHRIRSGEELPRELDSFLQPLHNAQILLIREHKKWNSFLLHSENPPGFHSLFPLVDDDSFSEVEDTEK